MVNRKIIDRIRVECPEEFEKIYKSLVRQKVRRRYDPEDEIAIIRQKEKKPEEAAEHDAYVEQCKAEAKAELGGEE